MLARTLTVSMIFGASHTSSQGVNSKFLGKNLDDSVRLSIILSTAAGRLQYESLVLVRKCLCCHGGSPLYSCLRSRLLPSCCCHFQRDDLALWSRMAHHHPHTTGAGWREDMALKLHVSFLLPFIHMTKPSFRVAQEVALC